jgi:16S rRNA (uracil1498-N3)-methyltransferase
VNARFYVPGASGGGQIIALSEDEAQHLTRVLRLTEGAPISVFDGRGREFQAVVEKTGKTEVLVAVGPQQKPPAAEPRVGVTLVQAVLKGDKMDDVIRDAVMMGVFAIQPTVTARTEIKLSALVKGRRQERWQKIAISSAKQCGRATVPEILAPCEFALIPPALGDMALPGPVLLLVEPSATIMAVAVHDLEPAPPGQAMVIVGPEGGWSPEEIEATATVCLPVTLGARTLRADAMAVVALSALFTIWKEF